MLTSPSGQPVPARRKALRIKTSFHLGQHPIIPFHWAEMAAALVTVEGTKVGTVNEAEVKNVGRRGKTEARAKKKTKTIQIKAYASTFAYSNACTKACSINKLDPRESRVGLVGLVQDDHMVFISVASNSSKHLLVPRASLIKHCGQCCTLSWFLPSVFVFSRLLVK